MDNLSSSSSPVLPFPSLLFPPPLPLQEWLVSAGIEEVVALSKGEEEEINNNDVKKNLFLLKQSWEIIKKSPPLKF